jgi:peptidoglycan hydrolase-like protein with peptidoglycan-binding domain
MTGGVGADDERRRRWRALVWAVAGAVVLLAACAPEIQSGSPVTSTASTPATTTRAPTTTTTSTTTTSTTVPPTTTTTTVPPTTTTTTTPPVPSELLGSGDEGPAVAELQARLETLHFWVGSVDGTYGWLTEQAVYAFQKANGITVDGRVGPETWAALADSAPLTPRSDEGRAIEIDKARQLLYAVLDGELQWVFHTSTGTEQPYPHPEGFTATADTPPGTHTVYYQVDGWQEGVLGPMYRPKYFHHDGIALHGYHAVPRHPASHGCARVTFDAMDFIWANDLMPMRTTVLVYGETPAPGPAL